jgi:two-component sensor histidine kinase
MTDDLNAARSTAERLAALDQYHIIDTEPEASYDDIVLLAARICEAPIALISLLTDDRQWFKARIGFDGSETPIEQSVCAHALLQKDILIIRDLTLDERTKHNALVTKAPFIRFYAGALLETPSGIPIGTLCVIDTRPRPDGLNIGQIESLKALARQVMSLMELRQTLKAKIVADAANKQHQEMLRDELHHRLKNILAMVQAIISQTFRHTKNFDETRAVLSDRIVALGKAQEILFSGTINRASLTEIVESAVKIYPDTMETQRFRIHGPAIEIGSKAALSLTLMMHELITNATKYGALATPEGSIAIDWTISGDPISQLSLAWRESGGPPVTAPTRRGFGTQLIERALASDVGATIELDYQPSGLECRLKAPLSGLEDKD